MGFKPGVNGWGNDRRRERMTVVGWGAWCVQDEVNQEDSEQDEVDSMKDEADSTNNVTRIQKSVGDL